MPLPLPDLTNKFRSCRCFSISGAFRRWFGCADGWPASPTLHRIMGLRFTHNYAKTTQVSQQDVTLQDEQTFTGGGGINLALTRSWSGPVSNGSITAGMLLTFYWTSDKWHEVKAPPPTTRNNHIYLFWGGCYSFIWLSFLQSQIQTLEDHYSRLTVCSVGGLCHRLQSCHSLLVNLGALSVQ